MKYAPDKSEAVRRQRGKEKKKGGVFRETIVSQVDKTG